ncbi:DUF4129 domain-containing protein [Buchananella hordeovulneris]|nr:DUF4129 domain-containing protein [Buchananella hordeovulneris]
MWSWRAPRSSDMYAPPVTPDPDEARQWLLDELAKPVYHSRRPWYQELLEWLASAFSDSGEGLAGFRPAAALALLALVLVVSGVAVAVARSRWRAAPTAAPGSALLFDDARNSQQLRAAADAAAATGNWDLAVLERYRALIRDLDEQLLIADQPGLTATQAARLAGGALPPLAAQFAAAGRLFDSVVYGDAPASAASDAFLRELAQATTRVTP